MQSNDIPKTTEDKFYQDIKSQINKLCQESDMTFDEKFLEDFIKSIKPKQRTNNNKNNINDIHQLNFVKVQIKNQSQKALFDTGAACSLIDKSVANKLKLAIIPSNRMLSGADSKMIPVTGEVVVKLTLNNVENYHEFIVVENCSSPVLLGIDFINDWQIKSDFANTILFGYH